LRQSALYRLEWADDNRPVLGVARSARAAYHAPEQDRFCVSHLLEVAARIGRSAAGDCRQRSRRAGKRRDAERKASQPHSGVGAGSAPAAASSSAGTGVIGVSGSWTSTPSASGSVTISSPPLSSTTSVS